MKSNWNIAAAVVILLFGSVAPGISQQRMAPELPRQSARPLEQPSVQAEIPADVRQNPFLGGVTEGEPTSQEIALSLQDAIARGLRNNLGQYLSKQQARVALGQRWRSRSGLLPNIDVRTEEILQQVNLAAFGFGGFPGLENPVLPSGCDGGDDGNGAVADRI